jgi:hypothetical protein
LGFPKAGTELPSLEDEKSAEGDQIQGSGRKKVRYEESPMFREEHMANEDESGRKV